MKFVVRMIRALAFGLVMARFVGWRRVPKWTWRHFWEDWKPAPPPTGIISPAPELVIHQLRTDEAAMAELQEILRRQGWYDPAASAVRIRRIRTGEEEEKDFPPQGENSL